MPMDRLNAVLTAHVESLEQAGTAKGAEAVVTGVLPAAGDRGPRFHLQGQGSKEFIRMNSNWGGRWSGIRVRLRCGRRWRWP